MKEQTHQIHENGRAGRIGGRSDGLAGLRRLIEGRTAILKGANSAPFYAWKNLDAIKSTIMIYRMTTTLPISRMSTADKLLAMEELWASLTAEKAPLKLPSWHKKALLETEQRVQAGKEEFIDWDEAKKSLRRRTK